MHIFRIFYLFNLFAATVVCHMLAEVGGLYIWQANR